MRLIALALLVFFLTACEASFPPTPTLPAAQQLIPIGSPLSVTSTAPAISGGTPIQDGDLRLQVNAQATEIAGLQTAVAAQAAAQGTPAAVSPPAGSVATGSPTPSQAASPSAAGSAQGTKGNPYPKDADVRVGDVDVKVVSAEVTSSVGTKSAQGKYVVVKMSVENVGTGSNSSLFLYLADSQGRQFNPTLAAYVPGEHQITGFLGLNPNMPSQGSCIWDVPKDAGGLLLALSPNTRTMVYVSLGGVQ